MDTISKELSELERRVKTLPIPDIALLTHEQLQVVAARIMNLSGKLNHLAYQLLFTQEAPYARDNEPERGVA